MSFLDRFARVGAGIGVTVAAAVILSGCAGPRNSSGGGPTATATTATIASPATTPVQAAKPVQPPAIRPADVCATATKATLEAALKADKEAFTAVAADGRGRILHDVACAAPWAVIQVSGGNFDGDRVLFHYQNGAWVPRNWGSGGICDEVPAVTAERICA